MTIKFDTEIPNTQFKVMATLMPGLEKNLTVGKGFNLKEFHFHPNFARTDQIYFILSNATCGSALNSLQKNKQFATLP